MSRINMFSIFIAFAILLDYLSLPYLYIILASSSSCIESIHCFAVIVLQESELFIRIFKGPSLSKENSLWGFESCIEETPISNTIPSTGIFFYIY